MVKLLPGKFIRSLGLVAESFLKGVWTGIGLGPKKKAVRNLPKPKPKSNVKSR